MANLMILNKCNRRCPYCFADEFTFDKEYQYMSFEDFRHAVDFSVYGNEDERIGIIGGEPTLHPELSAFMEYVNDNPNVRTAVLFTNGIELYKFAKYLIPEKFHVTININPPSSDSDAAYKKTLESLDGLINDYNLKHKINLGINMYGYDFEYEYMINLLDKYGFNKLRTSVIVPNHNNGLDGMYEHMILMKARMLEFYRRLYDMNVVPTWDCNAMPHCFFTEAEKEFLGKIMDKGKRLKVFTNMCDYSRCGQPIDILPDLQAVRCFGLSDKLKVSITEFKSIGELRSYFYRHFDTFAMNLYADKRCIGCKAHDNGLCYGGCLVYKIDKIEALRELSYRVAMGG